MDGFIYLGLDRQCYGSKADDKLILLSVSVWSLSNATDKPRPVKIGRRKPILSVPGLN